MVLSVSCFSQVCPILQDRLPLRSVRNFLLLHSLRGSISPPSLLCISAALLITQNSPGAKLLAGFETKWVPNESKVDTEGDGQGGIL